MIASTSATNRLRCCSPLNESPALYYIIYTIALYYIIYYIVIYGGGSGGTRLPGGCKPTLPRPAESSPRSRPETAAAGQWRDGQGKGSKVGLVANL